MLGNTERPFGLKFFNQLAKELAEFCDFKNPKK